EIEVGRDLHIFEVQSPGGQRRRDAGDGTRVVHADHEHLKGIRCQRSHLHFDRVRTGQTGEQAEMAGDLRGRVALEIERGQAAKVPVHQEGVDVGTLAADNLQQSYHASLSFAVQLS